MDDLLPKVARAGPRHPCSNPNMDGVGPSPQVSPGPPPRREMGTDLPRLVGFVREPGGTGGGREAPITRLCQGGACKTSWIAPPARRRGLSRAVGEPRLCCQREDHTGLGCHFPPTSACQEDTFYCQPILQSRMQG